MAQDQVSKLLSSLPVALVNFFAPSVLDDFKAWGMNGDYDKILNVINQYSSLAEQGGLQNLIDKLKEQILTLKTSAPKTAKHAKLYSEKIKKLEKNIKHNVEPYMKSQQQLWAGKLENARNALYKANPKHMTDVVDEFNQIRNSTSGTFDLLPQNFNEEGEIKTNV